MFSRVTTIPTVGFNVETVTYKNVRFNVWVSFPFLGEYGGYSDGVVLGRGRTGQNSSFVETLLYGFRRLDFCGGFSGSGSN